VEAAILIAQSAAESKGAVHTFLTYVPLLVFATILSVIVYAAFKAGRRATDRSFLHMERLEAKTDEVIGLLKEIRDKSK
jgi:hypothetical protein